MGVPTVRKSAMHPSTVSHIKGCSSQKLCEGKSLTRSDTEYKRHGLLGNAVPGDVGVPDPAEGRTLNTESYTVGNCDEEIKTKRCEDDGLRPTLCLRCQSEGEETDRGSHEE